MENSISVGEKICHRMRHVTLCVFGRNRESFLLEGTEASPVRPSNKNNMKLHFQFM
jgi:hypothetical protein